MKQNYFIKLVSVLTVFTLIVSCGNKTNQGKGLLEAAVEMVDPRAGAVDMGFPAENGEPLYWAKGNLVAKADGTFVIAPTPEYIASSRYYSDESKEWDLFGWADTTGKNLSTDALAYPSPKEISGNADYDIATKLGGKWRMPTNNELKRLFSHENSLQEWTVVNGVAGMRLTSKKNGNSIFLPAAGTRRGQEVTGVGKYGAYLSSTVDPEYGFAICGIEMSNTQGVYRVNHWFREVGRTIRPVTE